MKNLAMALTFFGLMALTAIGQQSTAINTSRSNVKNNLQVGPEGHVWCGTSSAGKPTPCTASDVAQLNTALSKSIDFSKQGTSKSGVKSIVLAKDGSLLCMTGSGTSPCTAAHLPDLKQAQNVLGLDTKPPKGK